MAYVLTNFELLCKWDNSICRGDTTWSTKRYFTKKRFKWGSRSLRSRLQMYKKRWHIHYFHLLKGTILVNGINTYFRLGCGRVCTEQLSKLFPKHILQQLIFAERYDCDAQTRQKGKKCNVSLVEDIDNYIEESSWCHYFKCLHFNG